MEASSLAKEGKRLAAKMLTTRKKDGGQPKTAQDSGIIAFIYKKAIYLIHLIQ